MDMEGIQRHPLISSIFYLLLCSSFEFAATKPRRRDVQTGEPDILVATGPDLQILQVPNSGQPVNRTVLIRSLQSITLVDYVFRNHSVFFVHSNGEDETSGIFRTDSRRPGRMPETVIDKDLGTISGLACDWRNAKLYFIDKDRRVIEVCDIEGITRTVLVWEDLEQPKDVVLDPIIGYMFWLDADFESPRIERSGMDGSDRTTVIDLGHAMPGSLALDPLSMALYWTDNLLNQIQRSDYDGSSHEAIHGVGSGQLLTGLTLLGDNVYWSNTGSIRAIKYGGSKKRFVAGRLDNPLDIKVYSGLVQPLYNTQLKSQSEPNPCEINNGNCSSLCLLSPVQPFYTCACKTGIQPKNGSCSEFPEEFLILAQRDAIKMISLDTDDLTAQVIIDEDIEGAVAVDFDPVEMRVYWSDDVKGAIESCKLDGSDRRVVVNGGLIAPDGIAVDWISRSIYWTDSGHDRIEMSRLDGSARRILIDEDLDEPRAIILDPARGLLYWCDWGDPSRIERASLDGTNRTSIINTPGGWPNGIAIDYMEGRIMWGTGRHRKIETSDLEGANRSVIIDNPRQIFGFAVGGEHMYWTDWNTNTIERAQKHTGQDREVVAHFPDLMGIKAVTNDILDVTNACSMQNGGCSHICIYKPSGVSCLCPAHMELSRGDRKSCIFPGPALIYWADNQIRKVSLPPEPGDVRTIVEDVGMVGEIDTDAREGRIYWTDPDLKTVNRIFANGTGREVLIEVDLKKPMGVAVDWMGRNLFFTDEGTAQIEVSKLNGSNRRVLIMDRLSGPKSIAVDPKNGYLFWADWGNVASVERSLLDGTERIMLTISCPSSYLATDPERHRIYWVVPRDNRVESADMSGRDKWLLLDKRLKRPTSIVVFGDDILFANSRKGEIEAADKEFGANRTVLLGDQRDVTGFAVLHSSAQPFLFENPCAFNNGGCEVFCMVLPGEKGSMARVCECPLNKYLNEDGKTCSDFSNYLLVSFNNFFQRIPIDSSQGQETVLPLRLPEDEIIQAIDYDPVNDRIYWIDATTRSIKCGDPFGVTPEIFLDSFPDIPDFTPFDIIIDPYRHLLIFSEESTDTIAFVHLELRNVSGVLFQEIDKKPRHLGLMPERGRIFWTDAKWKAPKIMSASLDMKYKFIQYRLFGHPLSFTLNEGAKRLFWMDPVTDGIEVCNVEERYRNAELMNCAEMSMTVLRKQTHSPHNKYLQDFHCGTSVEKELVGSVSGMTVFGSDVYWGEKDTNTISMRDIYGRGKVGVFREHMVGITDIKAVYGELKDDFMCADGAGCSHLCMVRFRNIVECACPKNMELSDDGVTCQDMSVCDSDQFECGSGELVCIPLTWRCDGLDECQDASDELDCGDDGP